MHHRTHEVLVIGAVLICSLSFIICAATSHATVVNAAISTKFSFAETSADTANSTITNSLSVSADGISIGSSLEANGKATIDQKPLADAPVALHMGDVVVATTTTNATGEYEFSAPVGLYYFPAAIWGGAAVYSVVTAPAEASSDAPSTVTNVAVDPLPLFVMIVAIVVVALLVLQPYAGRLNPYVDRLRGKAQQREAGHEQHNESDSHLIDKLVKQLPYKRSKR
jgi:hypothetical protein